MALLEDGVLISERDLCDNGQPLSLQDRELMLCSLDDVLLSQLEESQALSKNEIKVDEIAIQNLVRKFPRIPSWRWRLVLDIQKGSIL
jgi:hypothetical protein